MLLVGTPRDKRVALGPQQVLYASPDRGVGQSVSRTNLADNKRQQLWQELDTKPVARSASKDSPATAPTPGDSGSLPDRCGEPLIPPSVPISNEALAESADCTAANPNPITVDDIIIGTPPPPLSVESVPSLLTRDSSLNLCIPPVEEAAEVAEIAAPVVMEESVVKTRAFPLQEVSEVVEAAPFPATNDDGLSREPFPVQATTEAVEMNLSLASDNDGFTLSLSPVQERPESDVPPALPVANDGEEPRATSLLAFYRLRQQPFDVTPDPAYLYLSRVHREALTALLQGIENLRGFMALVAEPGMGKTTLLNKLMNELGNSARVVFLFQTQCNSSELLRYLLAELGVEYDGTDMVSMHKALSQVLFDEMLLGRRFVLIMDEAQNLQDSVLETIRLLSDYETTHSKLIQIVLAGQPQLVETLMRPNLVQLRQRIAVLAHLEPLDFTETAEYIEHRLRAAGSSDTPLFTRDAMALIAERSEGIPRNINNICFNAMLTGYLQGQEVIDAEIVRRVASKLDLELLVRRSQPDLDNIPAAASTGFDGMPQLAHLQSAAPAAKDDPDAGSATKDEPMRLLTLTGRLIEKLTSQGWSGETEFSIEVSLEREYSPGLPIADHYYCRRFYVSEEQAKSLQPGKPVRVKFEQD